MLLYYQKIRYFAEDESRFRLKTIELNPIERIWEHLKKDLKWELFDNLDALRARVSELLSLLTSEVVASLTGYDFILNALSVANIL